MDKRAINHEDVLLHRYIEALEVGDLDEQERILDYVLSIPDAETRTALEEKLWDVQLAIGSELLVVDAQAMAGEAASDAADILSTAEASFSTRVSGVRTEIIRSHLSATTEDTAAEEQDPPPLTLGDVAAQLRVVSKTLPPRHTSTVRELIARLEAGYRKEPVDVQYLTLRGATSFLVARIGLIGAHSWLCKQFHEVILALQLSHEREMRLAAARRHRNRRASPVETGETNEEGR